jgi:arylsulfatase A-like enzyme
VREPGAAGGSRRVKRVTRSIDVFPTLAGLAGIPLPRDSKLQGRDLSRVFSGGEVPELVAYSHTGLIPSVLEDEPEAHVRYLNSFFPEPDIETTWVGLRSGDRVWKYRRMPGQDWAFSVFDVVTDPAERIDRFREGEAEHQRMARLLVEYKQELEAAKADWDARRGGEPSMSREELTERLRALGCVH